ncbi:MAG: DUF4349 domain-containing protein [Acidimicrobiia bacterium]
MTARPARVAAPGVAALLSMGALVAALSDDDSVDDENATATSVEPFAGGGESEGFPTAASDAPKSRFQGPSAVSDEEASPAPAAAPDAAAPARGASTGAPQASGPDVASLGGAPIPERPGPTAPPAPGLGRVIKTAAVGVEVDEGGVPRAADKVMSLAEGAGGWVHSSEEGEGRASLEVKVPSERFEQTLAAMTGLGKEVSRTISGEDVSAEFVDLEGRLRHWRAQEAVFLELMTKARTIPDTIAIQQQLSSIQSQIEQIEGRRRFLEDRTAYSTVRISLTESGSPLREEQPAEAGGSVLGDAWEDAAGAALAVFGGTLVVLGVVLPLVVILAVPGLIWSLSRRRQARPVAPAA